MTSPIGALLTRLRSTHQRCEPADLPQRVAEGALVVYTRPADQRLRHGDHEGALVGGFQALLVRADGGLPRLRRPD